MKNNKKNILALMIILVPLVMQSSEERKLTVKERLALLSQAQAKDSAIRSGSYQANPKQMADKGYVELGDKVIPVDRAKLKMLDDLRQKLYGIEFENSSEFLRDVIFHQRRNSNFEPRADIKPHVMYLKGLLSGISPEVQDELLEILLIELTNKIDAQRRER